METVKLTKSEVKELSEAIVKHCYENAKVEYLNGCRVSLFDFSKIEQIFDEIFFETLPRFAEVEDEFYIDETQMEEICEKIAKELEGEYEVCDSVNFYEAREDYEYNFNRNPKNWID